MTKKIARFYDDMIIQPPGFILNMDKSQKFKITDAVLSGIRDLNVTVAATHASRITRNNTLYLPTKMRQGLPSLLSRQDGGTSPSRLPIFINHNKYDPNGDPIGRITGADYIDLTNSLLNTAIGDSVQDMNLDRPDQQFYQFLDALDALMDSGALYDPAFKGTGYIRAILNITDEQAVKKFLDGRYVTVSTSFTSNKAVCSICRENWAEMGEPCEHKPGKFYDKDGEKHKCFLVPGDMNYDEISVAHRPGDDEAIVLSMDGGNSPGQPGVYSAQAADSYEPYELKWQGHFNDSFDPEGGQTMKTREENLNALKGLWSDEAMDLFEKIDDSVSDETLSEVCGMFNDATPSIEDLTRALGINVESVTGADITPEVNTGPVEQPAEVVVNLEDNTNDVFTFEKAIEKMLDDKALTEEEADVLYEAISTEIDDMIVEGIECSQIDLATSETVLIQLTDAKLSSDARKKLSSGTFCGPERSFPVPDCAHVTAARRLIGKYEGPGSKDAILNCVSRKARAMGCDTKQKSTDNIEMAVKTILERFAAEVTDMERDELVAIYQAAEHAITERNILPPVECTNCSDIETQMDTIRVQRDELNDTLIATRDELQRAQKDAESYMEQLSTAVLAHKDLLRQSVASMRKLNGTATSFDDICNEIKDRTRSELENDYNELHANYNFDTINSESRNALPEQLVDPTIAVQDENVAGSKFDSEFVPVVVKRYQDLVQVSKREAEGYISNMIIRGIVPDSFDINEHLQQEDDD